MAKPHYSSRRQARRFEGLPAAPVPQEAEDALTAGELEAEAARQAEEEAVNEDENSELFGEGADERRFVIKRDVRRRIDVYLLDRLKGISRNRIQKLIELGGVKVNGKQPKPSTQVLGGDVIDVILPAPAIRTIEPEEIPLHVLYEDEHFIVVNKQAGLIVHPARSHLHGTLLNALAFHFKQAREAAGGQFQAYTTRGFRKGKKGRGQGTGDRGQGTGDKGQATSDARVNPVSGSAAGASSGLAMNWQRKGAPHAPVSTTQNLEPRIQNPEPRTQNASADPDLVARFDALAGGSAGSKEYEGPPVTIDGLSQVGSGECRPGVIHRLDKYTTGVMVVGKSDEAHWAIASQFADRTTTKAYLALVHGNFTEPVGVIDQPIGKHPTIREAFAVRPEPQGRNSVTVYRVREQYQGYSLVELELKTGRTHQIRVHMTHLGYPIAGDIVYGGEPIGHAELVKPPIPAGARRHLTYARAREEGVRLEERALERADILLTTPALHAGLLSFTHPITRQRVLFTAPLHEPFLTILRELRKRPAVGPVAKDGWLIDLKQAVPVEKKSANGKSASAKRVKKVAKGAVRIAAKKKTHGSRKEPRTK